MSTLTIQDKSVRTFDNLYCLNDIHKASNTSQSKKPHEWSRQHQTKELIQEIVQSGNPRLAIKTIHGGANRGTYACKELVYAYAMWISPKFHLYVIRAFDAIPQTPQSPTLPEIPDTLQKIIDAKLAEYSAQAFNKIKTGLEKSAREIMRRNITTLTDEELLKEWCWKHKLMVLEQNDIIGIKALATTLEDYLGKFNNRLVDASKGA